MNIAEQLMPYPERTVWCWWNFMQTGLLIMNGWNL